MLLCQYLIHAVYAYMGQERLQVGVRQNVILGNPRQDLQTAACSHSDQALQQASSQCILKPTGVSSTECHK